MKRPCQRCGTVFEAQRSSAKWCSSSCSVNASKDPAGNKSKRSADAVERVTRDTLEAAGRLNTFAGGVALALAAKLDESTGSAAASVARELRAAMDAAMEGAKVTLDEMDELQARRDSKRRAG